MIVSYCCLFFILSITYRIGDLLFNTFTKSHINLFYLEKKRRRRKELKVG